MLKTKNTVIILSLLILTVLIFSGCDERKGSLNAPIKPHIEITDYFGEDNADNLDDAELFQQTINWSAWDEDGVVEGFAFRVLNTDGEPIATPDYDYLDEDGWVIHYTENADESIPISSSDETTIWISQTYTTINFPAADADGDSSNVISKFEVKCIDNDGVESDIAEKYFLSYSAVPSITIQSSKGLIDGETIGLGIIFQFNMLDDPNLPTEATQPYYFEYKLEKEDLAGNILDEANGGYSDQWVSTLGEDEIDETVISQESSLQLIPSIFDDSTGVAQDSTVLWVQGVSIAGIRTEPVSIKFAVSDQFHPGSFVYYGENAGEKNVIYALGENHFATYLDPALSIVVPSITTSENVHNATAFWVNTEGEYTLIGSDDIKIYMKWGWAGEYDENNPLSRLTDETLDEATNKSYFSEITHFDIRVDDAPLYYPPLPPVGENLKVDEDGTEWFRVPISHNIGQQITLTANMLGGTTGLYGQHSFTVRAVDLQGVVDPTPHTFTFNIERPIAVEERSGVLIIDNDVDTQSAITDTIDFLYNYFVSEFDANPGYLNRNEIATNISNVWGLDQLHFSKAVISPTDMQQYKTIIYHSDNPVSASDIGKEYESLEIYLNNGGNLILSGAAPLSNVQTYCRSQGFPLLQDYFGIPLLPPTDVEPIKIVSNALGDNPFFVKAFSEIAVYDDMNLQLPSFNPGITNPNVDLLSKDGLGPVAYFNMDIVGAEILYSYGCKAVGEEIHAPFHTVPTQEEFDMYNGQTVAIRRTIDNTNCYMFGFPLSYMVKEEAKTVIAEILTSLGH